MIAVLADDLSGAAEIAGAALARGLAAEVQTAFAAESGAEVICLDIDSRSRPAAEAQSRAAEAARQLWSAHPAWLFQKCDSVLRGNVLAEIRGVLAATGKTGAVIVPANPTRGRVIRGGRYFIGDQPLHETAFASDPEHPRRTSALAGLLEGDTAGILTPDAASAADIAAHAASVGPGLHAVGGKDFFDALLDRLGPRPASLPPPCGEPTPRTVLAVCGSAAGWEKRRRQAEEAGVPAFCLPHDIPAAAAALRSRGRALLGIGEGPETKGAAPAELAGRLARAASAVAAAVPIDRLHLEGGATAAAVVRRLGWTRLKACGPFPPGIGALRPIGRGGLLVLIKPGSYDWPAECRPF